MVFAPVPPADSTAPDRTDQGAGRAAHSVAAVTPVGSGAQGSFLSQQEQALLHSATSSYAQFDPAVAALIRRRRNEERRREDEKPANRRDLIAARLRGGLVQYMMTMGYSMDTAVQEADRTIVQLGGDANLLTDKGLSLRTLASRQVYVSDPATSATTTPATATIGTFRLPSVAAPEALVDIQV